MNIKKIFLKSQNTFLKWTKYLYKEFTCDVVWLRIDVVIQNVNGRKDFFKEISWALCAFKFKKSLLYPIFAK